VPFKEEVRNPMQLRHKQETQLAHGALSLVDVPSSARCVSDSSMGAQQRVAVFTDHGQQLFP